MTIGPFHITPFDAACFAGMAMVAAALVVLLANGGPAS